MIKYNFYNNKAEKTNSLIFGYLENQVLVILKDEKNLATAIPGNIKINELELIKTSNRNFIGLAVKKDKTVQLYDHNIKPLQKSTANKNGYEILNSDTKKNLPLIFKNEEARIGYFNSAGVMDNSWKLENSVEEKPNPNEYYLFEENRNYFLKSRKNDQFKLKVSLFLYSQDTNTRFVHIDELNATFFYDSKYMNEKKIMFPDKYLKIE